MHEELDASKIIKYIFFPEKITSDRYSGQI